MSQVNNSKATIVINKIIEKVQFIIGSLLVFLFGLGGIMSLTDNEKDGPEIGVTIVLFFALGVWLIYLSRKKYKLIKNFKIYVPRLSADPTGSLENLAAGVGTSLDDVKKNLQKMIDKKYFVNAYLDTKENRIVFPSMAGQKSTQTQQFQNVNMDAPKVEYTTITCKNCGAMNKAIKGNVTECEFCGSQIRG